MSQVNILTSAQAARLLKVSPREINKWFDSGRLKGYRLPGQIGPEGTRRIYRDKLLQFAAENNLPVFEEELREAIEAATGEETTPEGPSWDEIEEELYRLSPDAKTGHVYTVVDTLDVLKLAVRWLAVLRGARLRPCLASFRRWFSGLTNAEEIFPVITAVTAIADIAKHGWPQAVSPKQQSQQSQREEFERHVLEFMSELPWAKPEGKNKDDGEANDAGAV
jgi:excisionase family DNA binding protein